MAYVNVAEWKPDQVTEWLKGLDNAILPYLHLFINNEVSGQQLLNVQPDDLDHWGVKKLGHQEIILEAVEHLRNFHYEIDRENLQLLALRLSCQAHSLHNDLCKQTDSLPLSTQTLADVASVVRAAKPLVCWLDRSPFSGQHEYTERKTELLKHSLEIAICAQRDRFAERPVEEIRANCAELAHLADSIIQKINDPLILQPASLDLATLRKRGSSDLGFFIVPSFHGVHQVCMIKYGSPAHQCGKVEEGDEVVQVNYQTVVGWQQNKVMALFEESPTDVFLTLKKRPRHTKVYGQIYMKPYRLPSKKRAAPYTRWHENLPSPRPELLTIPDFELPLPKTPPHPQGQALRSALRSDMVEAHPHALPQLNPSVSSESDDDALFLSEGGDEAEADYDLDLVLDGHASPTSMRLYLPKPRGPVQRRATITGASPTSQRPPIDLEKFWRELKLEKRWRGSDPATATQENSDLNDFRSRRPDDPGGELCTLRDKSVSLQGNFHRETDRPSTCLGIEKPSSTPSGLDRPTPAARAVMRSSPQSAPKPPSPKPRERATSPNVVEEPVRNAFEVFGARRNVHKSPTQSPTQPPEPEPRKTPPSVESKLYISRLELQVTPNEEPEKEEVSRKISTESQVGELPCVPHRERGRLDKSHSTPAYDLNIASEVLDLVRERKVSRVKEETDASEVKMGPPPESEVRQSECVDAEEDMLSMKFDEALPGGCAYTENESDCALWEEALETNTSDYCTKNCEVRPEVESHGRVVETINRHLLTTNLGKEDDDSSTNSIHSEADEAYYNKGLSLTTPDLVTDTQNRRNLAIGDEPNPNPNLLKADDPISTTKLDNQNQNHIHLSESDGAQDSPRTLDKDAIGCSKIGLILNTINNALKEESLKEYKFCESEEPARVPLLNVFPRKECGSVHPLPKNTNLYGKERQPDVAGAPSVPPMMQRQQKMLTVSPPTKICITPPEPPPRPPPNPYPTPTPPLNQSKSNLSVSTFASTSTSTSTSSPSSTGASSTGPSPTGGLRAIISKGSAPKGLFSSPKAARKKNPLLAKRRDIGVKDLGTPDCQGMLCRRLRGSVTGAQWVKGWFMLKGTTFYGFKSKEAQKADCFISLPGFTISQAEEVKSRRHAFKVYHTGKVFYFAADSEEELALWLDRLSAATLALDAITAKASFTDVSVFSETEDEADEPEPMESCFPSPKMKKLANFLSGHSSTSSGGGPSPKPARSHQNLSEPKIYEIQKKFGSLKKLGYRGKNSAPPPPPSPSPSTMSQVSGSASISSLNTTEGSSDLSTASAPPPSAPHSLDRKYLRFLSSNKNQNIPVPTAQFRSYRRVVAPDSACSTLPAGTKIGAGHSSTGQGVSSAAQAPGLGLGLVPGFTPNTGVYEQHRLPGERERERGQGLDQQASLRGRPFLNQSVESVLANFEEVEGSIHPPGSTSPRPAVPPRRDLMPSSSHGDPHSSLHSGLHSGPPSMDMADYRLTASGRRARRLNLSDDGGFPSVRPEDDRDRRHLVRTPNSQMDTSPGTLPSSNEAYAGYTEDPVSSLQRQQASLERRRNSPPPPPMGPPPVGPPGVGPPGVGPLGGVPPPLARTRGSPPVPAPRPTPPPPAGPPPSTSSVPPVIRRTPVTAHRQKKSTDRPTNHPYRGNSPEVMWSDTLGPNSPMQRRSPSPCGAASAAASAAVAGAGAGASGGASSLYGLKNAALYQPPPVAFGSSFGPTFEMNLDQRGMCGEASHCDSKRAKTSKFRQLFSPRHGQSSPPHSHKSITETPQRGGTHNFTQVASHQKTLLGSPRLHRAIFRNADGRKQKPMIVRSDSSGTSFNSGAAALQDSPSLSSSPSSSISSPDWPHESYADHVAASSLKPTMGVAMLGKKPVGAPAGVPVGVPVGVSVGVPVAAPRNTLSSPQSPPPDYPGLEYPPVFEPGTYSLSDTSTLLQRTPSRQDIPSPNLNGLNDTSPYS